MTTTSFKMNRHSVVSFLLVSFFDITLLSSCTKDEDDDHPSNHSSEVLDKCMTLQLRLMRNATGIPNQGFSRHYAYAGVAALESLAPGYTKWHGKWNGLTGLPQKQHWKRYFFPANVNAAMAAINKALFPTANVTDKAAIDSLEAALNAGFLASQPQALVTTSADFGKAVAAAVFNWAETDDYKAASNAYTPPLGPGL